LIAGEVGPRLRLRPPTGQVVPPFDLARHVAEFVSDEMQGVAADQEMNRQFVS
jgi:hypothetical protein